MTMELNRHQFENAARLAAFVIVDPCKSHLVAGLGPNRSAMAGILSNARRALQQARALGLPVAIIRSDDAGQSAWIHGFEPRREDALLRKPALSCYSNPYFDDIVQRAAGRIVLCGFLGEGGSVATIAGAIHAGHAVTVLRDATLDGAADPAASSLLRYATAYADLDIAAESTSAWIASAKDEGT
ncbi:MAG TPA: isochorismatase family protein [Rhizomicrobium sp.]|nr:isochorismatase family protein [Rhizomicrobium sp.]